MRTQANVLIVDDDPDFGAVASNLVELEGLSASHATNAREALMLCREKDFDVVLLDLKLGADSGLEVLREIRQGWADLPVIVITAHGSLETAAAAVREKAFDYLGKPFPSAELIGVLRRALEWRAGRKSPDTTLQNVSTSTTAIVGNSPAMVAVYRLIARVADTDSTVLIAGESGTGKELIARALHDNSSRTRKPFVPINCGAFTETLLESELFGHVRGAFTGAANSHRGIFETASGGTVFLDEISETSPAFQVKLLRVLQEQEVRPVGASEPRRVNVRIVAATNRPVPELLNSDDFRQDLLYRLSVIHIQLPPLRDRSEDIPLLVEHFLQRTNAKLNRHVIVPADTLDWLKSLTWPGNVRELENAVERAITLNASGRLLPEDFIQFTPAPFLQKNELAITNPVPSLSQEPIPADHSWRCAVPATLDEVERQHILATLRFTDGNKLRAAELLGIGRYSLYRKAERLGIKLDSLSIRTTEP
ncbi:MAG: sigma-54-dependent Fis family transcriptional regulator [Acidobacteria bacterium]|nr:sigma-54-dependent Fis family transcriptional regulator [Acidobacteriota bacterium]